MLNQSNITLLKSGSIAFKVDGSIYCHILKFNKLLQLMLFATTGIDLPFWST